MTPGLRTLLTAIAAVFIVLSQIPWPEDVVRRSDPTWLGVRDGVLLLFGVAALACLW